MVIGPFLAVVALLAILAVASVDILSAVRAYVGGESLWSKGQKDSIYHLGRYIASRDPVDYLRFQNALAVPLGDRRARIALEKPEPDLDAARRGFLDGGNHPADIDGMVQLFVRFQHVSFMADAIAIWAEADEQLSELAGLGRQIERRVVAGETTTPELRGLIARLPDLNERLTRLEERFSATLGEASRTARNLVVVITIVLAAALCAVGVFLTAYMLRQQSRIELALRESNDRWAMAAGAADMGLFDWDLRTGHTRFDARAAALFGLPEEATEAEAGDLSRQAVHPDDLSRVRAAMSQAIAHPAPINIRYRLLLPDGSVRHVESIATVRASAEGVGVSMIGIVRDVSDQVKATQLELDKEAAERAYRAKGEFLSRVSHELRTPLNAVLGFSELMKTDPTEPLSVNQTKRVQQVLDSGRRLLSLINDILDLSSLDESAQPLAVEPVALAPVIRASVGQIETLAREQNLMLQIDRPDPALCVLADARRLEQVLVNLLANAVKYNRPGGELQLSCERIADQVLLTVRDTGAGMRREQIDKLFQPFNRLGAEFTKVPGSGLGLVITQQLVQRMGGRIDVQSTEGVGTRMEVRLRAAPAIDQAAAAGR